MPCKQTSFFLRCFSSQRIIKHSLSLVILPQEKLARRETSSIDSTLKDTVPDIEHKKHTSVNIQVLNVPPRP